MPNGDLDGDGDLDRAVTSWWGSDVSVPLNRSHGTFGHDARHAVGYLAITLSKSDRTPSSRSIMCERTSPGAMK